MRLPFISRRHHETAVDFLAAVHQSNLATAAKALDEEQAARRRAEAELEVQGRVMKHLTDQLLNATGYQGEPLLPEARTVLGIEKEDAA